ncbi:membrane-bound alpha-1,6- mannosyltransferase Initiation-specific [Physocladia obscura]|uniref:Membrane-bound alpha-1,6- mannosyltransferase Initiation-specific n=1 Tax=Physocladia obscura TaxID=109957 RepID=A0AAD5SRY5_9FUNG|nr:membrane-bound alpha-1,6- mannosyltransferase Initiation-specific [Physocladia obscura]
MKPISRLTRVFAVISSIILVAQILLVIRGRTLKHTLFPFDVPPPNLPPESQIPCNIVQTYQTSHIDQWRLETGKLNRTDALLSWRTLNTGHTHIVLNDSEADNFMRIEMSGRVYTAFAKMPLMVLRADLLRYAMIWKWGGVYSDSDTICEQSINKWSGEYSNATLIVSVEWYKNTINWSQEKYKKTQLVQWTFAASANHPVFWTLVRRVTQTVRKTSIRDLLNTKKVEEVGGPEVFSAAVQEYLKSHGESLDSLKDGATDRVYFPNSRVLVLPWLSFAVRDSNRGTDLAFSSHKFAGFDKDVGWKNGKGKIIE